MPTMRDDDKGPGSGLAASQGDDPGSSRVVGLWWRGDGHLIQRRADGTVEDLGVATWSQNAPSGPLAGAESDDPASGDDPWLRGYQAGYRAAQDALGVRFVGDSLIRVGSGAPYCGSQTEAIDHSVIVGLRYALDVARQRVTALKGELQQVADALGTGETGEGLVSVARAAHTAEQELAANINRGR